MISSPFLLAATVKYHLNEADALEAKKIENNMYVDNMIRGVATEEQEDEFYHEAKPPFYSSSMNLREWASNFNSIAFQKVIEPMKTLSKSLEQPER